MEDGFSSMDTAPRDGTVFPAQMVSTNVFDIQWLEEHRSPYSGALVPAGWCDALTKETVTPLGWRPPVEATKADGAPEDGSGAAEGEEQFRTVGDLMTYLVTLPRDLPVVLASDGEGNSFGFLADKGQYRVWDNEEVDILDEEDAKDEGYTDEEIAAGTQPVVILWPEG